MDIKWENYPEKFWHCRVRLRNPNNSSWSITNDATIQQIRDQIVEPWHQERPFIVGKTQVTNRSLVEQILIEYTPQDKNYYFEQHKAKEQAQEFTGGFSAPFPSRLLPFGKGTDYTKELLFN